MAKSEVALLASVLALFAVSTTQAQITIDISKITCEQFRLSQVANPQYIAVWISGYYHGKSGGTVIDTEGLKGNVDKVKDYCLSN